MKDSDKAFIIGTLAPRIAPGVTQLDERGRGEFLRLVEEAVDSRTALVQRQISLFLSVLRWAPVLRWGAPLDRLDAARQDAALKWFHSCPVPLLRSGFWGVKTLVLLGYYGQPEIGPSLGYRPEKNGNKWLVSPPPSTSPKGGGDRSS